MNVRSAIRLSWAGTGLAWGFLAIVYAVFLPFGVHVDVPLLTAQPTPPLVAGFAILAVGAGVVLDELCQGCLVR